MSKVINDKYNKRYYERQKSAEAEIHAIENTIKINEYRRKHKK